uniref:Uncharacterized protein n=1 Tax=Steinernema glaseri TaxID=37863 RepID=A0A1I7ZH67_9BILA
MSPPNASEADVLTLTFLLKSNSSKRVCTGAETNRGLPSRRLPQESEFAVFHVRAVIPSGAIGLGLTRPRTSFLAAELQDLRRLPRSGVLCWKHAWKAQKLLAYLGHPLLEIDVTHRQRMLLPLAEPGHPPIMCGRVCKGAKWCARSNF